MQSNQGLEPKAYSLRSSVASASRRGSGPALGATVYPGSFDGE